MRLRVIGGPADGARVAGAGVSWRWIDGEAERGYSRPQPGCGFYVRRSRRWTFAGFEAWRCAGCGVLVVERRPECPLCGFDRERQEAVDG